MSIHEFMTINAVWLIIGFAGQSLFSMRFIIQWLHSERVRKSVIPVAFWYFSLSGCIVLLAYSIHRRDPVYIIGQLFGALVYSRNLYFIYRERQQVSQRAELEAESDL